MEPTPVPPIQVRDATAADVDTILAFIRDLAAYEREPDAVLATRDDLLRDGFGATPRFHVLLACTADGQPVGFAFHVYGYSTWRGRPVLYLEDLWVTPAARGQGAGMALMRALARRALEQGCARMTWQVLDWNAPALDFYRRLGAQVLGSWLPVRLDGPALVQLAGGADAP